MANDEYYHRAWIYEINQPVGIIWIIHEADTILNDQEIHFRTRGINQFTSYDS